MEHHACPLGVFPLQYSALFALRKSCVDLIISFTQSMEDVGSIANEKFHSCCMRAGKKVVPKGSTGSNGNE